MNRVGQTMQQSYEDLIKFPRLVSVHGSLTAMEKILLGHFILLVRPRLTVELGVFKAITTQFMCDFLVKNGIDGVVVGFDLPEVIAELRDQETVKYLEQVSRLRLIPGRLPDSLANWLSSSDEQIDLALVDASHDYRSVIGELSLLWPRLSPEGYILCDDYCSKHDGVRYAVDHFAARQDAMALPLLSSQRVGRTEHTSELVAVCRRPYEFTLLRWMHHLWLKAKADMLAYPVVNKTWSNWVRPFVRRNSR